MKDFLPAIVAIIAIVVFLFFVDLEETTVVYDCRLSEISPDFPPDVKEECRRIRYQQWKDQQIRNMI